MKSNPANPTAAAAWRDSIAICALADGERHLGHILKIGERWYAFDATRFNEESNGFRSLGTFASVGSAKEAVEFSSRQGFIQYAGAA
jgi:hypothetical protein